jgi:hypothetical protein
MLADLRCSGLPDTDKVQAPMESSQQLPPASRGSFQSSTIDSILGADPTGEYGRMDSLTQADYREAVQGLAARSGRDPVEVANLAIGLASRNASTHGAQRASHVGCYLLAEGRRELVSALGIRETRIEQLRAYGGEPAVKGYAWAGTILTLLISLALLPVILRLGFSWWTGALFLLATMLLATFISSSVLGNSLGDWFPPRRLPRMHFPSGIPAQCRTLVVVPCMLTSSQSTASLVANLERHFLHNRDPNLGFCLLTDFADAPKEQMPSDADLLAGAVRDIEVLNERHGGGFAILHRARRWNPAEGCWMGWERKRGKLEELNCYLLDAAEAHRFSALHGDLDRLRGVAFVVTLDDDNSLPAGQAAKLVAIFAHPLNRAHFDASKTNLLAGYGILAPRRFARAGARQTRYQRWVFGEESQLPPDGLVQPSLFQDMMQQSNYVGKGIYDVAAFHRISFGHVPENRVLAHDVLECAMVRTAEVSDVILPENMGGSYEANQQRICRWLRGEFQLAPWFIAPRRMTRGGRVSAFGRWFIFDNIRRMLAPIASLAYLSIGWLCSDAPGFASISMLVFPLLLLLPAFVVLAIRGRLTLGVVRGMLGNFLPVIGLKYLLNVYEAQIALDAIGRASFRLLITKRRLLEWSASALVDSQRSRTLVQHYYMMWSSPAFALVLLATIPVVNPPALLWALPPLALWIAAPAAAWWMGHPANNENKAPNLAAPA